MESGFGGGGSYMKELKQQILQEYQDFLNEVVKKLVRAEIDKAVFDKRRNDMTRDEKDREQQNKFYGTSSDSVNELTEVILTIKEKIKEVREGKEVKS